MAQNTQKQYLTPKCTFFFNFPCCGHHHLFLMRRVCGGSESDRIDKHFFMPLNSSDNHGSVHMFSSFVKTKKHADYFIVCEYSQIF